MKIRKTTIGDIKEIHSLINTNAEKGLLLPRSLSELYDHLRDYSVITHDDSGPVIGVCGLGICWENLSEIKSLAIHENERGKGYGIRLVESCLKEAKSLDIHRVFTLTYIPDFFDKLGFKEIDKTELPHKIWADCLKCPKFPECDETAQIIYL